MNIRKSKLIAIVGGIGSGKSVVSCILESMGYKVYDCDSKAKTIMDNSAEIHKQLCAEIHPQAVVNGVINRQLISQVVFNDESALKRLNAIVHKFVLEDLKLWRASFVDDSKPLFVETAIPRSSNILCIVDDIWEVTAPIEVRISRVIKRNNISREQVIARIRKQEAELDIANAHAIQNDGEHPILPVINKFLTEIG